MKTIKQIQNDIREIEEYIKDNLEGMSDGKLKKEKNRIQFLRNQIKYLERNPSESFIKTELKRIQSILSSKISQYKDWEFNVGFSLPVKKRKSAFNKEVEITLLKKQSENLNYLLS